MYQLLLANSWGIVSWKNLHILLEYQTFVGLLNPKILLFRCSETHTKRQQMLFRRLVYFFFYAQQQNQQGIINYFFRMVFPVRYLDQHQFLC